MTVSGVTMTSAGRQSVHERDSHTHSQRSAFTSPHPSRPRPFEHLSLMAQGQEFEVECGPRLRQSSDRQQE
jgi:hypothetical protein